MKYADNVLKGFATSVSIIISVVFSAMWLRETELSSQFMFGTALVMTAAYVYGTMPATQPSRVISSQSAENLAKDTV